MAIYTNTQQLLGEISDSSWIRQSLLMPERGAAHDSNARSKEQTYAGGWSYQHLSFADTTLGGNRSINPKPQFTRFADPNLPSLLANTVTNGNPGPSDTCGMGRYYAEAIDVNAQRIYMQFGVPSYNSLSNFISNFYDPSLGPMANSGQTNDSILYTAGKYIGFITLWTVVPELCITAKLYGTAKKALASFQHRPLSKFYYMKPTMALYWSTVTTIVNALSVNMKLVQGTEPGDVTRNTTGSNPSSDPISIDYSKYSTASQISNVLPDFMLNNAGGIDIRQVSARYQRLSDAHNKALEAIRESTNGLTDEAAYNAVIGYINGGSSSFNVQQPPAFGDYYRGSSDTQGYINSAAGTALGLQEKIDLPSTGTPSPDKAPDTIASSVMEGISSGMEGISVAAEEGLAGVKKLWYGISKHFEEYAKFATAEGRDGSAFVSFIVDYESHVSESFNNSTKESDIANKMNDVARSAKNKWFDLAGGNISDNIVVDTIEGMVSGLGKFAAGYASGVGLSGLALLGGKAFVDIPEFWDTSTVSLPTSSYSIQLRTPYGNPISILTNILVPTAMLIAAAAPRTTGRNSYTGPFLCKLWQKGRTQIQLGMITSLSITRGAGNVGWNVKQQPLAIDINFTVTNLSKILHVPITTDLSLTDLIGLSVIDEENNFTDYMAVLGSLGLADQYYFSSRWRLRKAQGLQNWASFLSVDHFLQWEINDTLPGNIVAAFARQGNL